MDETGTIQLLSQNQIDKTKWDICIDQAPNGLIYAYSWYLDTMAKNWDALVYNDYELVMPLTWKKKNRNQIFVSAFSDSTVRCFRKKYNYRNQRFVFKCHPFPI